MSKRKIDLTGRRILVVEDDYALATDICSDLRRHGAIVLGPAPTSHYAFNLLMGRRGIDTAVLDIRLHNSDVFELAEHLHDRAIPMVFTTGYAEGDIPWALRDTPRLFKPVDNEELVAVVDQLVRRRNEESNPEPEPSEPDKMPTFSPLPLIDRLSVAIARAMRPLD
jgi:DNA-binding response OmpR family regulator